MDESNGTELVGELTEERLEGIRRRRFEARVKRVLEAMQRERVDWRGVAFIAGDGRIGVRVVPIELPSVREEEQP